MRDRIFPPLPWKLKAGLALLWLIYGGAFVRDLVTGDWILALLTFMHLIWIAIVTGLSVLCVRLWQDNQDLRRWSPADRELFAELKTRLPQLRKKRMEERL